MSYVPDANVLLYASDQSSDRHDRARRFVESCAAGPEILCLTWPTLTTVWADSGPIRATPAEQEVGY